MFVFLYVCVCVSVCIFASSAQSKNDIASTVDNIYSLPEPAVDQPQPEIEQEDQYSPLSRPTAKASSQVSGNCPDNYSPIVNDDTYAHLKSL